MKYALNILRVLLILVVLAISVIVWKERKKTELEMVAPYGEGTAVVVWNSSALDEAYWTKVQDLCSLSVANGKSFYILTDTPLNANFGQEVIAEKQLLEELMPSNGGALIFSDGIITDRFPRPKMPGHRMVKAIVSDTDFSIAESSSYEQIFLTGLFVLLLLSVMIVHHIKRRRKLSK